MNDETPDFPASVGIKSNDGGAGMSYEVFKRKVNALIAKAGGNIRVRFSNDNDKGRFFANCSDGTTIIGNPDSLKVTVRFGSGHQSMAAI